MQPRAASVNFPLVRCANYVGIVLALTLQRLYPNDFALEKVQRLLQHQPTIDAIKAGETLAEIKQLWANDLDEFKKRREKFLIYK